MFLKRALTGKSSVDRLRPWFSGSLATTVRSGNLGHYRGEVNRNHFASMSLGSNNWNCASVAPARHTTPGPCGLTQYWAGERGRRQPQFFAPHQAANHANRSRATPDHPATTGSSALLASCCASPNCANDLLDGSATRPVLLDVSIEFFWRI